MEPHQRRGPGPHPRPRTDSEGRAGRQARGTGRAPVGGIQRCKANEAQRGWITQPCSIGAKTKLGFVPFPSQVLCPSFPDADVEGRDGPSLAETNSTLNLLSWEVGATLPLRRPLIARLPGNSPAQSPRCLWEGSGATRPRHLMLFPAGGRTAEKSETPPSTSASRPRGQSTKGGGRRERGWSHRVERAQPGRVS